MRRSRPIETVRSKVNMIEDTVWLYIWLSKQYEWWWIHVSICFQSSSIRALFSDIMSFRFRKVVVLSYESFNQLEWCPCAFPVSNCAPKNMILWWNDLGLLCCPNWWSDELVHQSFPSIPWIIIKDALLSHLGTLKKEMKNASGVAFCV